MASSPLTNYLRKHRKRLGLSQDEVAFLLGTQSGTRVCRNERFVREPSLETALAYEVIFQQPIRELFRGLFRKIEKEVAARAGALAYRTRRQKPNRQTRRKHQVLDRIINKPDDET